MTIPRDEILEIVKGLPQDVDTEELIYRLYLKQKLAAAEADIAAGRTVSAEEARKQATEWQR